MQHTSCRIADASRGAHLISSFFAVSAGQASKPSARDDPCAHAQTWRRSPERKRHMVNTPSGVYSIHKIKYMRTYGTAHTTHLTPDPSVCVCVLVHLCGERRGDVQRFRVHHKLLNQKSHTQQKGSRVCSSSMSKDLSRTISHSHFGYCVGCGYYVKKREMIPMVRCPRCTTLTPKRSSSGDTMCIEYIIPKCARTCVRIYFVQYMYDARKHTRSFKSDSKECVRGSDDDDGCCVLYLRALARRGSINGQSGRSA